MYWEPLSLLRGFGTPQYNISDAIQWLRTQTCPFNTSSLPSCPVLSEQKPVYQAATEHINIEQPLKALRKVKAEVEEGLQSMLYFLRSEDMCHINPYLDAANAISQEKLLYMSNELQELTIPLENKFSQIDLYLDALKRDFTNCNTEITNALANVDPSNKEERRLGRVPFFELPFVCDPWQEYRKLQETSSARSKVCKAALHAVDNESVRTQNCKAYVVKLRSTGGEIREVVVGRKTKRSSPNDK